MIISVAKVIIPIFLMIFVGYWCRLKGMVSETSGKELNKLIYFIALPSLFAAKLAQTNISLNEQWVHFIVMLLSTLFTGVIALLGAKIIGFGPSQKWVCAHGSLRSNMAFIGLPITFYALGDAGLSLAVLLMGVIVPFYNIAGVILLTLAKREAHEYQTKWIILKKICFDILKNPLIWGCVAGGILKWMHLEKEHFGIQLLELMGNYSIPLSLICLGIQMNTTITWKRLKMVILPSFLKLILTPLCGFILLNLLCFPLQKEAVLPILILLGCPSAVASYVMAVEMKADYAYAADIVLASSLFSLPTLFMLLGILKYFHFW